MSEEKQSPGNASTEAKLLKHGYIKIQEDGDYKLFADTLCSGYDIMYTKLDSKTEVFYVCRGKTKKLFPIFEIESAILMSRRTK